MLKLLGAIKSTPLDEIARAQAEDLAPLWSAFENSNHKIKPLPNAGREDIPFTRAGMETLARDIARYLHIAQTQLPVIVPMPGDTEIGGALEDMKAQITFINGGGKRLFETYRGRNAMPALSSNFGFMSVRKEETGAAGVKSRKLVALPVFALEKKMLDLALGQAEGREMLEDFQQMIGIVNHDYFHHLTARIITPYFDGSDPALLKMDETPLGALLGPAVKKPGLAPDMGGAFEALKAENAMQFKKRYESDPALRFKTGADNYEFHSLYLHAAVYQDLLHDGPQGKKMLSHLHSYFARLNMLANASAPGDKEEGTAQAAKIYYSSLVYNNLLRIVPHGHKLAQACEKMIDGLDIPVDLVRKSVAARLMNGGPGEENRRIEEAARESGVPIAEIGDQMKELKVSELLRWENYVMNADDLNRVHMPQFHEERERALPAMREFISAVARDVQLAKWRGGIETCEALARPQAREPG
jgi:hypothetical protein